MTEDIHRRRRLNKTKILAFIGIFILIIGLFIVFFKGFTSMDSVIEEGQEPIKIGALLSLSGDAAYYGVDELRAVQLAVDEANEKGGVNGRKIELVIEDAGTLDEKNAINALKKLVHVDKIQLVIGPTWDMPGVALVAEEEKIVLISPDNTEGTESGKDLEYFYSTWVPQKAEANAITRFAEEKGIQKVVIMGDSDIYSQTVAEVFKDASSERNIKILDSFITVRGSRDLKTELLKIQRLDADAIFMTFADEALIGPILKQMNEMQIDIKVLGTVGAENGLLKFAGYAEDLIYYTYPKPSQEQEKFFDRFEQKYGIEPQVPAVTNAYDAANILIDSLRVGATNADEIRDYLNTHDFESITYGKLRFDERGFVSTESVEYVIKTVKDGKFVELRENDPL